MMVDAALLFVVAMALAVLLARHWPRPVLMLPPPKNPCGFMPPGS